MSGTFTDELWQSIAGTTFAAILAHPFLQGLTDGSLDEGAFRFYVQQDALYLRDFGRGLSLLAARADLPEAMVMFNRHAQTTVWVEQALHAGFLSQLGQERPARPAPNCLLYTSYLLRVAYDRPWGEALGAFLPCYWIYSQVGKALKPQGSPHPLYQRWIDTYGSPEFEKDVGDVLATVDRVAALLSPAEQERLRGHFLQSSTFEYMFWDMAYHYQKWPGDMNR